MKFKDFGRKSLCIMGMIFCIENGAVDIHAQEVNTEIKISTEEVEANVQNPIELENLERENGLNDEVLQFDIEKAEEHFFRSRTVLSGSSGAYLEETGNAHIYTFNLPSGIYIQAQLEQPADENIDYDLYILNSDGYTLKSSRYDTELNDGNTLPEAIGYITTGEETDTYYLMVISDLARKYRNTLLFTVYNK